MGVVAAEGSVSPGDVSDRVHSAIMVSGFFPTDDKEELLFQENTARDMELHGEHALAAVVIEGADHDSSKAAVLHPKFLEATENMIGLGAQR